MCPGGDEEALQTVMPLLERVAAKDPKGRSCVGMVGKGGSGHYVKMVHNGIEHGMMSAISEAWGVMRSMGMGIEEIGNVLGEWNKHGEFRGTFLIAIGADLAHKRDSKDSLVLPTVADKVVQDVTGEEGTGVWSNAESIQLHVPAPTLNVAHAFRIASAYLGDRERAKKVAKNGWPPQKLGFDQRQKDGFIEDIRKATFAACLASYIQGLIDIDAANKAHDWNINYQAVLQIWKAGCIIQADYISEELLAPVFGSDKPKSLNLLFNERVVKDVRNCMNSLRIVVAKGVETDQVIPALSASLEYFKIVTGTNLPTSFYEAELDYFGAHMYDKKGEKGIGGPTEGKHHFEWKPATTLHGQEEH